MQPFIFDFPVWVIVDQGRMQSVGLPEALTLATTHDKGNVFPIFTDQDLAERFLRETAIPGAIQHEIPEPKDLIPIAEAASHAGITNAAFDLGTKPGSFRRFAPLAELLAHLRGRG
jgi:hypothetical protein